MGCPGRTLSSGLLLSCQVDTDRNLVYIKGQVPGPAGRMVLLRDALNVKVRSLLWYCALDRKRTGAGEDGCATGVDLGWASASCNICRCRALCLQHDVRVSWGLPFPTFLHVAEPETTEAKRGVRVYQQPPNALDPYRAYADDSDYFGVKWKKSD